MEMKTVATPEEIEQHLALLNEQWRRFGDIEDGHIVFGSDEERQGAALLAEHSYEYEELWLAEQGYPWHSLIHDLATRSFSLPQK